MKHPSKLDWRYKSEIYAKNHGYFSALGGWIYYLNHNNPVCQGWHKFYNKNQARIESYMFNRWKKSLTL